MRCGPCDRRQGCQFALQVGQIRCVVAAALVAHSHGLIAAGKLFPTREDASAFLVGQLRAERFLRLRKAPARVRHLQAMVFRQTWRSCLARWTMSMDLCSSSTAISAISETVRTRFTRGPSRHRFGRGLSPPSSSHSAPWSPCLCGPTLSDRASRACRPCCSSPWWRSWSFASSFSVPVRWPASCTKKPQLTRGNNRQCGSPLAARGFCGFCQTSTQMCL
jgi:hypothetical protein